MLMALACWFGTTDELMTGLRGSYPAVFRCASTAAGHDSLADAAAE